MHQVERFSPLNPIRFTPGNQILDPQYNTYGFDRGMYWQQIRTFYQLKGNYPYKLAGNDVSSIYVDSLAAAMGVHIYSDKGVLVSTSYELCLHILLGNKDSYYGDTFKSLYKETDMSTSTLPDGYYYVLLEFLYQAPGDPVNTWHISEPIWFRRNGFKKTMLIEYYNKTNDYDVLFQTFRTVPSPTLLGLHPIRFQVRAEMVIDEVDPASNDTVFEDQQYIVRKLQSTPSRVFTLYVGGKDGVPQYVLDKINRILSCDVVAIDNVYYIKDSNAKWSVNRTTGYSKVWGSIKLREASPNTGWEYRTPALEFGDERIHDDMYAEEYD